MTRRDHDRPAAPSARHVPALDGLRGVAIAMVLLFHFYGATALLVTPSRLLVDRLVSALVAVGWCGVDLFFVLSGFLITGILVDAKGRGHFFRSFYARRVLRIFPIYYAFLFCLIVVAPRLPWMRSDADLRLLSGHQVWYWTYLFNVMIAFRPFTKIGWYGNGHLWSLGVEEQFYVIWPVIVFLASPRGLRVVCGLFVIGAFLLRVALTAGVIPALANMYAPVMFTPARLDGLALGGLLALAARVPGQRARTRRWAWPVGTVSLGLLLAILVARGELSPFDHLVQTLGFTSTAFLFAAVLALAVTASPGDRLHRVLTNRALRGLGRYSYALYLFHLQVSFFFAARFAPIGPLPTVMGSAAPGRLLLATIGIACSLSLAVASWHLYERRFLALKRFFPYRDGERPPAGHAVHG